MGYHLHITVAEQIEPFFVSFEEPFTRLKPVNGDLNQAGFLTQPPCHQLAFSQAIQSLTM